MEKHVIFRLTLIVLLFVCVTNATAQVPRIDIDISDGTTVDSKDVYKDAHFKVVGYGIYDDLECPVQIKGRGNATWDHAKKPYRLKFAQKISPFGLAAGKSWVLLANSQPGSLMLNAIAMKIGQVAGVPFTNHIVPVELYVNGEYRGSYAFTEQTGFRSNSVSIAKDSDKGYMLELDSYFDGKYKFKTDSFKVSANIKEPDLSKYSSQSADKMLNSIQADLNRLDSALSCGGEIGRFLDLEIAARFMLVNELVANLEMMHPKSTFLWKEDIGDPDSKIIFGPLWDFDLAFGHFSEGWLNKELFPQNKNPKAGTRFFTALLANKEFQAHYRRVWTEFIESGGVEEITAFISDYYNCAASSIKHNSEKWPDNYDYEANIPIMQDWIRKRCAYISERVMR